MTRRFYRSGESEYRINRNIVRLKDIHELFMDTGLGRDGYSMIGQGKIADIISVKSDERRQVFEEAAGISKYRYRRGRSGAPGSRRRKKTSYGFRTFYPSLANGWGLWACRPRPRGNIWPCARRKKAWK